MFINVTNSNAITGYVASLQIRREQTNEQIYLEISDLEHDATIGGSVLGASGRAFILSHAHGDASVRELRAAIATASDMFSAESTLGGIARLLKESFWSRLALEVQAEFVVVSTGHGLINDRDARILVSSKEVA